MYLVRNHRGSLLEGSVNRSLYVPFFFLRSLRFLCNNAQSKAVSARMRASQGHQTGEFEHC